MHTTLALLLCIVFVIALLKLDHRRFKPQSMASWIPTLWMIYSASKPFPYWFSPRGAVDVEDLSAAIIEGSSIDRIFLLVLIIVGLLILIRRKIDWHKVFMDNRWLFLLFFYMLVSISWSDYPFVSFKRWFKASGTIVMALVVLTGSSPREEIESILRRIAYILIPFSALLVKYFPVFGVQWGRYSGQQMWAGVTTGKNELGTLCMISALFMIWTWVKSKNRAEHYPIKYETLTNLIILGMAFWLLKGPGGAFSATSVVVLIIGLATLSILSRLKTYAHLEIMTYFLILATWLLILMMWIFPSLNPLAVIAEMSGRDANLTGRTDMIWDQLMPVAMQHPLFGTGYGGYWIEPLRLDSKLTVNQAHNGYIDIFIEIGVVGLMLFAIVIVAFLKKSIDVFKYDIGWGSFLSTLLFMSLLHNITESSYLKATMFVWNLLLLIMVACPRKISRE